MLIVCGLLCTTLQLLCKAVLIKYGAHVLWPCSASPQSPSCLLS